MGTIPNFDSFEGFPYFCPYKREIWYGGADVLIPRLFHEKITQYRHDCDARKPVGKNDNNAYEIYK